MIELILVIWLVARIGKIVRLRGYNGLPYQAATVMLWLGGELMGFYLGLQLLGNTNLEKTIYLVLLLGVACGSLGGFTGYLIAKNLPQRIPPGSEPLFERPPEIPLAAPAAAPEAARLQENLPPSLPGTPRTMPTAIADGSLLNSYLDYAEAQAKAGLLENAARTLEQGMNINPQWAAALAGGLWASEEAARGAHPAPTQSAPVQPAPVKAAPEKAAPEKAAPVMAAQEQAQPGSLAHPAAQPLRGYCRLLQMAGQRGQPALAAEYFRRIVELQPNLAAAAFQLATEAGIRPEATEICKEKKLL